MPSSAAPRPQPDRAFAFALHLLGALGVTLAIAASFGPRLVERALPLTAWLFHAIDGRFTVLALQLDSSGQDTVVALRANLQALITTGGRAVYPQRDAWLRVSTTVWVLFQPLLLACSLAWAWPGTLARRGLRAVLAATAGVTFAMLDLPLTLHAYLWDMFHQGYEPDRFSPLLAWHGFLSSGGRPALGVLIAGLVCLPWRSTSRTTPAASR